MCTLLKLSNLSNKISSDSMHPITLFLLVQFFEMLWLLLQNRIKKWNYVLTSHSQLLVQFNKSVCNIHYLENTSIAISLIVNISNHIGQLGYLMFETNFFFWKEWICTKNTFLLLTLRREILLLECNST